MGAGTRFLVIAVALLVLGGSVLFVSRLDRGTEAAVATPRPGGHSAPASGVERVPAVAPAREAPAERDGGRAAAPVEAEVGASSVHAEAEGTLVVLVRSERSGEPLPGFPVSACEDAGAGNRWSVRRRELASGRLGERLLTDAEGRVEFRVPAGRAFAVAPGGVGFGSGSRLWPPPLEPDERRELVLEVPHVAGLVLVGRVLDRETGVPVVDASVALVEFPSSWKAKEGGLARVPATETLGVDSEGYFEIELGSWQDLMVEVAAPGHGLAVVEASDQYASRVDALVIRLDRGSELVARAFDSGGLPLPGARVTLSVPSYELVERTGLRTTWGDVQWLARTGIDGVARLRDLPPGVRFRAECRAEAEGPARRGPSPFSLEPGERRELEFRVGTTGLVAGRVIRPDGGDAGGIELWLCPGEAEGRKSLNVLDGDRARTASTDEEGRFAFPDVSDGTWLVGPACEPQEPGFPNVAEEVVVEGGLSEPVLLSLRSDLFISGTVVGPDGGPVPDAFVHTWNDRFTTAQAQVDEAGGFSVGPLSEGVHTVSCDATGFEPVRRDGVAAGDEGLELRLSSGAKLRGALIDAHSGEPRAGDLILSPLESGVVRFSMTSAPATGTFAFDSLAPGRYQLTARVPGGTVAYLPEIVVRAGEEREVELRAMQGATLTLRHSSAVETFTFRVGRGSAAVGIGTLSRGGSTELVVPAGVALEVRWPTARGEAIESVTLSVGEERELELDGE